MSLDTPLDVICFGEVLVDFLPEQSGARVKDVETWHPCSGGSPANVAVGVARLGGKSAMVGVVGADEFGEFLKERLAKEGVDISHLRQTDEGKTGLVFISLSEKGERSFSFYRTRAAEFFLGERDVDIPFFERARAVHCGTNSLLFRDAQRAAVMVCRAANAGGKIVCCDPNLRLSLWPDPRELDAILKGMLPHCAVVKLSEEELEFVTGKSQPEQALVELRKLGVKLPIVTLGERGAALIWRDRLVRVPAPKVKAIDTTGAGDGFVAALLFGLTQLYPNLAALENAGIGEIRELVKFACSAGSRVTEQRGAVTGLPRIADVSGSLPRLLRHALYGPDPESEDVPLDASWEDGEDVSLDD